MDATEEMGRTWANLIAGSGEGLLAAAAAWLSLFSNGLAAAPFPAGHAGPGVDGKDPTEAWDAFQVALAAWTDAFDAALELSWAWHWPYGDSPVSRLLGHPAAAVSGDHSPPRQAILAASAWMDFARAAASHQALQVQGWMKALQRFAAEFVPQGARTGKAAVVASLDDLLDHWGQVGEATLQEHMRSDTFLQSQAQMLRTAMQFRVAQRRLTESLARVHDLPTLTDLDEAFSMIHDLRTEVGALRRLAHSGTPATGAEAVILDTRSEPNAAPGATTGPAAATSPAKSARELRRRT